MKRTTIVLGCVLVAIAALASCAKEPAVKEGLKFTATINNLSKTQLVSDGSVGKVNWVAGDVIYINGAEYTATPDSEDPTKAVFTAKSAEAVAIGGKYYASYGFQASIDGGVAGGSLSNSQSCSKAIANAPMYAESENTTLAFSNVTAVLEIELKGSATVTSVKVETAETNNGAFTVTALGTDSPLTFSATDEASKAVTVDCGDGVALTSDGVKIYVALQATTYSSLTISATRADGGTWSFSTAAGKSLKMAANTIYPLSFTPEFKTLLAKWRFKPDYTYSDGNGTNWCGQAAATEKVTWHDNYEPGEVGFFTACAGGSGKLSYVQQDKTGWLPSLHTGDSDVSRYHPGLAIRAGDNGGQPMMTGPFKGDYWQFETTGGANLKAGDKVHMYYTYASESYAAAYWLVEYKDGEEWKPAMPTTSTKIDLSGETVTQNLAFDITTGTKGYDYSKDVDFTVTLQNDNAEFIVRMTCCSNFQANTKYFEYPNNKIVHRIAGTGSAAHPFPFIEKL